MEKKHIVHIVYKLANQSALNTYWVFVPNIFLGYKYLVTFLHSFEEKKQQHKDIPLD